MVGFSDAHYAKMEGVDPRLIEMMEHLRAEGHDFGISEGLRDSARQRELVDAGKSKTMNSKHLTGNALDIHLRNPDGSANWNADDYGPIGAAAKEYAANNDLDFTWGGDWGWDSVHFQLNGPAYAEAKAAGLSDGEARSVAARPGTERTASGGPEANISYGGGTTNKAGLNERSRKNSPQRTRLPGMLGKGQDKIWAGQDKFAEKLGGKAGLEAGQKRMSGMGRGLASLGDEMINGGSFF